MEVAKRKPPVRGGWGAPFAPGRHGHGGGGGAAGSPQAGLHCQVAQLCLLGLLLPQLLLPHHLRAPPPPPPIRPLCCCDWGCGDWSCCDWGCCDHWNLVSGEHGQQLLHCHSSDGHLLSCLRLA